MKKSVFFIPTKNYVISLIICILTIMLVLYLAFWYKNNREYNENNSIMTGYLLEIGEDEVIGNLNNFVLDNPNTILYVSYGNDSTIKDFENQFKYLINENNIKSNFIYIDLNMINDKKFFTSLKDSFFNDDLRNKNIEVIKQPNLYVFDKGKITSVLYTSNQQININDIKRFLIEREVIIND